MPPILWRFDAIVGTVYMITQWRFDDSDLLFSLAHPRPQPAEDSPPLSRSSGFKHSMTKSLITHVGLNIVSLFATNT